MTGAGSIRYGMTRSVIATGAQTDGWNGQSRRRVPRFLTQAQVDLTVLRSGVPDTVPGRSVNVCERGISAIVAGELVTGESVGVELQLPPLAEPLRTRALVRYQDRLRCGLEFVALSAEQRASIRDWAKGATAEKQTEAVTGHAMMQKERRRSCQRAPSGGESAKEEATAPGALCGFLGFLYWRDAAGVWWWRWNRAWEELEFGLKNSRRIRGKSARASPCGSDAEIAGSSGTAGLSR